MGPRPAVHAAVTVGGQSELGPGKLGTGRFTGGLWWSIFPSAHLEIFGGHWHQQEKSA